MSLQKAVSSFEMSVHMDRKHEVAFSSRYEFLKAHNGIRPNCLHGMIGTTGSGKSTLLKCIITEAAASKKVLVWLSEESISEYQELIQFMDKSILGNINFVEEKKISQDYKTDQSKFFAYFELMCEESGCDVVFIDNITSSAFYNMRFGLYGQGLTAEYLMNFVKDKCAVFYVAHTETGITDNYNKVVAPENMRGSKELAIVTEYMYIIQKFTTNEKIYNVLRVAKFRHHKEAAGWYALKFEQSSYIGDSKVPFELINKIFKSRDFLGRASPKVKKDDDQKEKPKQRSFDIIKDDPDAF
jgi:ABC-type cobalamin/Fe3+-siderophores transport system ATPase subunit